MSPGRKPSRSPACERDREIRLARAGGADRERDRALANRVDVALLHHRLGSDLLAAVAPHDVLEHLADVLRLIQRGDDRADRLGADLVPALHELDELVHHRARGGHLVVVALDRQLVPAQPERAAEPVAQRVEHAVADARELGRDLVRNREDFLHPAQCRRCPGPRRVLHRPLDWTTMQVWNLFNPLATGRAP
jgi:hypothetical protein